MDASTHCLHLKQSVSIVTIFLLAFKGIAFEPTLNALEPFIPSLLLECHVDFYHEIQEAGHLGKTTIE